MNDPSAVYFGASAAGGAAFVYKLRDLLRTPRNHLLRAICTSVFLASTSIFFAAPTVVAFVNRATGVSNFAAPLVYSIVVSLGASLLVLVLYWRGPADKARRTARWWLLTYAAVLVALNALFVLGNAKLERRVDFDTYYATTPYIAEFIILYLMAHAVAALALFLVSWRWARIAGRPWLCRGLRVIALGNVCGLGFDLAKLIAVIARWLDRDVDWLSSSIAPALGALGTLIAAVGLLLPTAGERLTRMAGWIARYRAYRELFPLWDALSTATPDIVPDVHIPRWHFELRLTRRLAEINDGRLVLRSHIHPQVGEAALRLGRGAGLTGLELQAVIEAARLKAAVTAKAANREFALQAVADTDTLGGIDGLSELVWLSKVSQAFSASPVVGAALAECQDAIVDPAG